MSSHDAYVGPSPIPGLPPGSLASQECQLAHMPRPGPLREFLKQEGWTRGDFNLLLTWVRLVGQYRNAQFQAIDPVLGELAAACYTAKLQACQAEQELVRCQEQYLQAEVVIRKVVDSKRPFKWEYQLQEAEQWAEKKLQPRDKERQEAKAKTDECMFEVGKAFTIVMAALIDNDKECDEVAELVQELELKLCCVSQDPAGQPDPVPAVRSEQEEASSDQVGFMAVARSLILLLVVHGRAVFQVPPEP